jgi:hypothetical protein
MPFVPPAIYIPIPPRAGRDLPITTTNEAFRFIVWNAIFPRKGRDTWAQKFGQEPEMCGVRYLKTPNP